MPNHLAIQGGKPVRDMMLPYGRQSVDEPDIQAVLEVLRSDWLTTGPAVTQFEKAFAEMVGAKYAVAVSSGTAALHAAAFAAGIGQGDEVVTTPLTFAATANCVRYQGGTVVFCDVQEASLNLDPARIHDCLTKDTKAFITVDYAGQPSDLAEISELAVNNNITVIEDASHALGATYQGHRVGGISHMTTFSLHPVKHITTGEGGVVTTNDAKLNERLKIFRTHGVTTNFLQRDQQGTWFYDMVELGYNYRLTDIQCGLGLSQLRKLDGWVVRRREIAEKYSKAFAGRPEIQIPAVGPDRESAWHLYVIQLNLNRLSVGRAEIFQALRAENIGVNVHYIPVPWHSYYQKLGYQKGLWPVAERAYDRILSVPIFPTMTEQDIDDVVMGVVKVLNYYRQ